MATEPSERRAFGSRLAEAIAGVGPLCVGIDPHPAILSAWGLAYDADGVAVCAETMITAATGVAAVVKPQVAFFEAHGAPGIAVLQRVLAQARAAGLLVILDVKRGDVASTMDAYARAYLGDSSPLRADAITVSPYWGVGALKPAFSLAAATGRGLFVLARTSNPEGEALQRSGQPRSVAQQVADEVAARNPGPTLGSFGLVVGAQVSAADLDLSQLNGPVLAPGLGAQGGTPADLGRGFAGLHGLLVPTSSRDLMRGGPSVPAIQSSITRVQDSLRTLSHSS